MAIKLLFSIVLAALYSCGKYDNTTPEAFVCPERVNNTFYFKTNKDLQEAYKSPSFFEKLQSLDTLNVGGELFIYLYSVG